MEIGNLSRKIVQKVEGGGEETSNCGLRRQILSLCCERLTHATNRMAEETKQQEVTLEKLAAARALGGMGMSFGTIGEARNAAKVADGMESEKQRYCAHEQSRSPL